MNIVERIVQETREQRGETAVIDGDARLSYGDLLDAAETRARELRRAGMRPGQRVALVGGERSEYIVTCLAILWTQAAVVPISATLSRDEVDRVVDRIDVDWVICPEPGAALAGADSFRAVGRCGRSYCYFGRRAHARCRQEEFAAVNPAFIRFSSGTTAESKGVVLSHETIDQRTNAADTALHISAADTVAWVLPMSFHFAATILLFLRRGAAIRLCGGTFPVSWHRGLAAGDATVLYATPFHYDVLTRSAEVAPAMLSRMRLAVSTAMKLPLPTAERFHARFGIELSEAYGIIEIGLPYVNTSGSAVKRGSVGRISPGFQCLLRGPDGHGVGEICLKGPGMFDAYFSPWAHREARMPDGWFATGDLGHIADDGYLYLEGRKTDVINFTGMKIFPGEVEQVIDRHPAVQESIVYGLAHAQYGQIPVAQIVVREGAAESVDAQELRAFCYRSLAAYKVPKEFRVVARLEKTANGKIRRGAQPIA